MNQTRQDKPNIRFGLGFGGGLLLLLVVSALSWRASLQQETTAEWSRHTEAVLNRLESLLASVTDGETGQRGFLITGDARYLEPYYAYLEQSAISYQALLRLTADNPVQQARLEDLKPLLVARGDEMRNLIALRRDQGFAVAAKALQQGRGKALQDRIRLAVATMRQSERELQTRRDAETLASARLSRIIIVGGTALAFAIILAALAALRREWRRRAQAEAALLDKNEALREATARAQRADHIKSAFLATMSHELRTPLNSIIGFSGILLQELAGPLNPEQKKQLGMVRDSSRHLLALVNDVLDLSKIEAEQLHVARTPFSLKETLDKAVSQVAPLAERKGLVMKIEIPPDLGEVVSDPRRVEQVLLNLLGNAVKFTERGQVTLSAERLAEAAGPCVRLRVGDTGIGMRQDDLSELFQPFRQLRDGLARSHEGTGLGLAITKRLLALLGGRIEVASQLGKGSMFTVTLPVNGTVDA